MQKPIAPTLPVQQPIRKNIFALRLTDGERAEIEALVKQLKLPDSFMARHFILEAVAYHRAVQRENGLKAEPTTNEPTSQLNKQQEVNLEIVYRPLRRIAAHLEIIQSGECFRK